ncbi:ABC transporter ATP-binding protein [Thomasclavelia sp.]
MCIVETRNLKKYYNTSSTLVKALDGVNLQIKKGEFLAIIGTSGSGKTTLLNMIGGIDLPSEGEIYINNINIAEMSEEQLTIFRRRNIGFIFQNYNLINNLNVYENITLPIQLDGNKINESYIDELLKNLNLIEKKFFMPNSLSGGQQQRVAIARALAIKPSIILADEPTGNLDSHSSEDVIGLLKKTSKKYNQTILMITHNDLIAQQASRQLRIEDGKIKSQGG